MEVAGRYHDSQFLGDDCVLPGIGIPYLKLCSEKAQSAGVMGKTTPAHSPDSSNDRSYISYVLYGHMRLLEFTSQAGLAHQNAQPLEYHHILHAQFILLVRGITVECNPTAAMVSSHFYPCSPRDVPGIPYNPSQRNKRQSLDIHGSEVQIGHQSGVDKCRTGRWIMRVGMHELFTYAILHLVKMSLPRWSRSPQP